MTFKNIDKPNFFYSVGAVFILLGIIAKFLEWEAQDKLLFVGLSTEVLVFAFSSIQYKEKEKVYYWEKLFPEIDSPGKLGQSSLLLNPATQSAIADKMEQYNEQLNTTLIHFSDIQKAIHDNSNQYILALFNMNNSIQQSIEHFERLQREISYINVKANDFNKVKESTDAFSRTAMDINTISENSKRELMKFNMAIADLTDSYQKILKDTEYVLKNIKKN